MSNFSWPINPTTVNPGPVQFVRDGVDTDVSSSSGVPANSRPLPTQNFNASGSPVDVSTAALQTTGNTSLSSIDTKLTSQATAAKQDTGNNSLGSIDTKLTTTVNGLKVDGSAVTQPVSGPLTDVQLRATAVPVSGPLTDTQLRAVAVPISGTVTANAGTGTFAVSGPLTDVQLRAVAVPVSGPLTDAQLRAVAVPISGTVTANAGTGTFATSATQSGTWTVQPGNTANTTAWLITQGGRTKITPVRNDYSSVNVTTGAYVQLVASTSATINKLQIFDSSGSTMVLAVGAAASEVDQFYIFPGGNGDVELSIPSGSRISVKAVSASATSGELIINFFS